jgi:hypothetical protein
MSGHLFASVVVSLLMSATFLKTQLAFSQASFISEQALSAISNSLPEGWTITERALGEIPWGHHWCTEYTGKKGLKLVARGVKLVNTEFRQHDGSWRAVAVGTEALEIWLMPGDYRDSFLSWACFHRPI